jgi:catechol 2,3-dioxygenase-like lactoylglutathione lyase family enzyme
MNPESKTHGNRAMTRPIHRLVLAASLGLAALTGCGVAEAQTAPSAATGRMVQPRLIIHVVPDLEKSVAFYTDAVGYDVIAPPAELKASTLVHKAMATAATAQARAATLRIPGSNLQLQLVQFSGIEGKPFTQRHYDPGVTRFSVQVRDVNKAFNRVKDRGVTVDSTSVGPVFTQRPANNTQAVMMRDPDGFVLEFVEAGAMPQTDVPVSSNVYNARASLTLDKLETSARFYRDLLGFEISAPNKANDAVLALEGTPRASVLLARSMPPGSNNMWVLWEFSDIERTRQAPSVQDPGASAISVQVENLPALLKRMQAAGITIETPGGAPVALGDGHKGALVRSPDGLLVELVE